MYLFSGNCNFSNLKSLFTAISCAIAMLVIPLVAPITSSNNTKRGGDAPVISGIGEYGGSFPILVVLNLKYKFK